MKFDTEAIPEAESWSEESSVIENVNQTEAVRSCGEGLRQYVLLDKNCNTSQSNGTAYEMAMLAAEACGLTLGTIESEFKTFANGTETLSLYAESDIETWRDFISWVAQTVGCNVMAGRDGSIIFRPYGQTVVDTLDEKHRFEGASFSDFETRYTGLSCVNLADKMTKYYGMEEDTGLTYNLGTNPFLQYGVDETKDTIRKNILTALQQIDYVSFKATLIGNPAYAVELGLCWRSGVGRYRVQKDQKR